MLAISDDHFAVYENVFYAFRVLVRCIKGSFVDNGHRVNNINIGIEAFLNETTPGNAEFPGRERGHLPNRFLQ
jgi:hypothetical protein